MRAPVVLAWLSGLAPYRRRHECFFDDNQNKDEFYPPLAAAAAEVFPLEAPKFKPFAVDTVRLEGGLTFLKGRVTSADLSYVDNVVAKVHGGLRLSKCAVVLVNTLRREIQDGQLSFRGKRVLELGCGNGLPGIFACLKCLRPVYGVVYLAGKKHYYGFGGGGTRQFKSMVEDDGFLGAHLVVDFTDTSFKTKEVWKFFYH